MGCFFFELFLVEPPLMKSQRMFPDPCVDLCSYVIKELNSLGLVLIPVGISSLDRA